MTRQEPTATALLDSAAAGDAAVIAELAAKAVPVQELTTEGRTLVVGHGPNGPVTVVDIDHEKLGETPNQKRGQLALHTPASLADYAARHIDLDRTTIWGDLPAGKITVVLNDHSADRADDSAGWADHRAAVQLRRTPEWEAWTGIHEKPLGQVELAEFLEEHLLDVTDPDGSTLLDIVQTFQATSSARFKKSVVLHSGEQQLTWEETIDASAGAGSTEIPRQLTIRISPWMGVAPVDITAAFRFRIRDGRLTLSVVLRNLQQHSDQGVTAAAEDVADALELNCLYGTPPAPRR